MEDQGIDPAIALFKKILGKNIPRCRGDSRIAPTVNVSAKTKIDIF
jgi:hypothetical protein